MKRVYGIWVSGFKSRTKLIQYLDSCLIKYQDNEIDSLMGSYSWMGKIFEGDPVLDMVSKKYLVSEDIEYTTQEISQSPLLYLEVRGVDAKGDTGPDDGADYDFSSACDMCLSGAVLIPPFKMLSKDLPKKYPIAITHMGDILVSSVIAEELEPFIEKDNWLIDVEGVGGGSKLPWSALKPAAKLPKMLISTKGFIQSTARKNPSSACTTCKQDSYGTTLDTAFEPVYSSNEIKDMCSAWITRGQEFPDVVCTRELVGPGTRPGISTKRQVAQPLIFVSQRVARVLQKHAGKWIRLIPATLVE